jgi:hypothetical protein
VLVFYFIHLLIHQWDLRDPLSCTLHLPSWSAASTKELNTGSTDDKVVACMLVEWCEPHLRKMTKEGLILL